MKCLLPTIFLASTIVVIAPASQTRAAVMVFATNLSGLNESPPNASPGTGTAILTIDDIAHTMRLQTTFSGLLGNTTVTHIHGVTAVAGTGTAGVATTIPTFPGFPSGVTSGTYDQVFDTTLASSYNPTFITNNGGTPASAEIALFNGIKAGKTYLNIHTDVFPGGEIRGFFVSVPETASPLSLFAFGTLGVASTLLCRLKLKPERDKN